ncbi:hypothetical protein VI817_009041 [Penicillium citrinum]|nr:hypothetical protein VI817_009041 [Penicillium citrinum]
MNSTSFGDENSGTQVVTNHAPITHNYFLSGERLESTFKSGNINWKPLSGPERRETPEQNTDNGSQCPPPSIQTNFQFTTGTEILESLAFPQMLDRRDNIEQCHTNTCEWILDLEEYQSWRSQSHGLLWIKGKPGAGKSTLMVFLHDKLQISQDDRLGIRLDFFFTARGTEMQRTPLGMLRSLLNQIFNRDPTIRSQIREIYDRRCKQFGNSKRQWEWPQTLLEELLASAILDSANRQHVVVFVDALDEAGATSAQQLAEYFHRLVARAERKKLYIQVCISCRHYPIMESGQAIEIKVEDHNQQDIATYIRDKLIKRQAEKSTSQRMREMLVEQLTQQANGVFQWIHIIIPLIERKVREGESFDDICCWLREVPAGLEAVYTYILNNVIEKRNRQQSFLFFQWICLTERPLTVTEMRYALVAQNLREPLSPKKWERIPGFIESNKHMLERIKAISGGLAEVVPSADNNETVQVVHQSVNDFLRTKGLQFLCRNIGMGMLSMTKDKILSQCQATLYRSCLVYLATFYSPAGTTELKGTKEELIQDRPLVNYATINLFTHAQKAADHRPGVLQNEKNILQQVLGRWVQIYQKLNKYSRVCPPRGTTLLHMAAAANLVDLIEPMVSDIKDIAIRNSDGSTALHLAARWGHVTAGKVLRRTGADQEAKDQGGKTPLFEAASGGHIEFVKLLLDKDVNLEIRGDGGVLQAASLGGHESVVQILLGAGADINAQGGQYGNALQAAAYNGHSETVQILLGAGADVNAQGGQYGNALQAAVWTGSSETVQILLGAGADVNAQGGQFGHALQAAAYNGYSETVQILLGAGADVNAQGGQYGNALQAAALNGSPEKVQILLGAGADINAQGGQFGNALQAAVYNGHSETVQILLGAGADLNAQGGQYGNALQTAALNGSPKKVQILLGADADVNAQGGQFGNALQAAVYNGHSETVQILLGAGAHVNAQGGQFGNALQAAALNGSPEKVQILLGAGADINAQGGQYGNALQAAALKRSPEKVQILLGAGADVNAQGGQYGNALQAAALNGSPEKVQILLRAGADVNAQGGQYGNALQAAALNGSPDKVQILLRAGADVNTQGGQYGNALQAAVWRGHSETVQILLRAGADINAQGGQYGSPLLAAIHVGYADGVQILLHAGADPLLADELGRTPLHIAASKNMLHLLRRFPQLASVLNNCSDFSQTPLHLAVCHGHIDFAIALLNSGADPSRPDGYGRHVMDWAPNHETLLQEIHNHCSNLVLTPPDTQELTVHGSILELTESLPYAKSKSLWPLLQQLGRYFLFVAQSDNARYLFQLHLPRDVSSKRDIWQISCNMCDRNITGTRFVCRQCACIDLCSPCVQKYPCHSRLHPNQEHELFEVSNMPDKNSQYTGLGSERFKLFLDNLAYKHFEENTDQSEQELSNDSMFALAPRKEAIVPKTALNLVTITSGIIFAASTFLLGARYFKTRQT